jgi:type IV secretion system protein VirD4
MTTRGINSRRFWRRLAAALALCCLAVPAVAQEVSAPAIVKWKLAAFQLFYPVMTVIVVVCIQLYRRRRQPNGPWPPIRWRSRLLVLMLLVWSSDSDLENLLHRTPTAITRLDIMVYFGLGLQAMVVIAIMGGISWVRSLFHPKVAPPPPEKKKLPSDIHGTAHYAPLQVDVLDQACLAKGLFLGKSSQPGQERAALDAPGAPVCATPEHHTLIVARTRTGKGTRVIVPTLLRYGGSALVIDPKGENAAVTAAARQAGLGQTIHILNPWNELADTFARRGFSRATYNPLDILDRKDPNVVAVAQTLAGAICPTPTDGKDRFWYGSAANILTAVFLWLTDQAEEKTLARARQIISLSRRDFIDKYLTKMAVSKAFDGAIREMAAPLVDLAEETYSGIMANLAETSRFLSDPQIKTATAKSSFSMEDLVAGNTTVYVVIPPDRIDTQKTWLRLVIAAATHSMKRPKTVRRSGRRCLFLIDEFPALGRVEDLPRDIATISGFGVDFALIVQGLDQLKDHYGEARGTILGNCAFQWFCNINDLDSAKYLSESLGKRTVETTSKSDSFSPGSAEKGSSITHSETGRSLLNPDEIINLGKDVAIVIQPNGHPHYLKPVDYWRLGEAFGSLRNTHPSLYWDPPLEYDDNPYLGTRREGEISTRMPRSPGNLNSRTGIGST